MTNQQKTVVRRYIKKEGIAMAAARAGITYATLLRVLEGGKVHELSAKKAEAFASVLTAESDGGGRT